VTISNSSGTVTEGPFSPNGRIIVYGQSGNDAITIAGGVTLPGWIFAGNGNNKLTAGGGPSVLVGGSGYDTLIAGPGRDILIGGGGADSLLGGSGDDLMIGGHTAYDANDLALSAILAEWASADSLAVRMADILDQNPSSSRLNGHYFLLPVAVNGLAETVLADVSADTFVGGSGNDWLFGEFAPTDANPDSVVAGIGSMAETESEELS
jgi:Ca2+-binding RTX toxin-like protein